jgi:hypothetical protein
MSADGARIVVGAYGYSNNKGVARVYQWNNSLWSKMGANIPGEAANERNGSSVSMSADGTRIVVGASRYESTKGIARAYQWNNSTSSWSILWTGILEETNNDYNGSSVSMSADGKRIVIGGIGYSSNRGVARVYEWNNSSSVWLKLGGDIAGETANEYSGWSVSMSADGTRIVVGAYGYSSRGVARVYQWNNSTLSWSKMGADILGVINSLEQTGWSVNMSADGTRIVVGAPAFSTGGGNRGVVRVYQWNNTTSLWSKLGQDLAGENINEYNGSSVTMSADGTRIVVGAWGYSTGGLNRGIARVYFIPTNNMITYTSSNSSIADIYGNLLFIKGTSGTSNIVATQGTTTMNGTLTISGTSYMLQYTPQYAYVLAFIMRVS